jgi:hypothetical protein
MSTRFSGSIAMGTLSNATSPSPSPRPLTPCNLHTTSLMSWLGLPSQNAQRRLPSPPPRRTESGSLKALCPQLRLYTLLLAMQTAKGKPAKSITRNEFIEFMKRARAAFYKKQGIFANRCRWNFELGTPLCGEARQRFELPLPEGSSLNWDEGWLGWHPIFSFDNPPAHGGEGGKRVLPALQLEAPDHFELPSNSCDIHRVIEHTHARLVAAFNDWLYHDPSDMLTMDDYKRKLEELFYNDPSVASPAVIMGDVATLPELYEEIISKEGGWAAKAFR